MGFGDIFTNYAEKYHETQDALDKTIEKLNEAILDNTSLEDDVKAKNREIELLKAEKTILEDRIDAMEKTRERIEQDRFQAEAKLREEIEAAENRIRPGAASIDRKGLQLLCTGYFGNTCLVETAGAALAVSGTFGTPLEGGEVKLMLSPLMHCERVSQIAELLQPKPYPDLAEALGLVQFNPSFLFGQLSSCKEKANDVYLRITPVEENINRALVVIDGSLTAADDDLVKTYADEHSIVTFNDGSKMLLAEGHRVFPIEIPDTIKKVIEKSHVDGVGFGKNHSNNWQGTDLFDRCVESWQHYYNGVVFLNKA